MEHCLQLMTLDQMSEAQSLLEEMTWGPKNEVRSLRGQTTLELKTVVQSSWEQKNEEQSLQVQTTGEPMTVELSFVAH